MNRVAGYRRRGHHFFSYQDLGEPTNFRRQFQYPQPPQHVQRRFAFQKIGVRELCHHFITDKKLVPCRLRLPPLNACLPPHYALWSCPRADARAKVTRFQVDLGHTTKYSIVSAFAPNYVTPLLNHNQGFGLALGVLNARLDRTRLTNQPSRMAIASHGPMTIKP